MSACNREKVIGPARRLAQISRGAACKSAAIPQAPHMWPILWATLLSVLLGASAFAEDKKPEPGKLPPRVIMALPLAAVRGQRTKLTLRGFGLDSATEVRAQADGNSIPVDIKGKGKADLPKDAPAEKLGDTKADIEFLAPSDQSASEVKITVINAKGASEVHLVPLYDSAGLTADAKPNSGFQAATVLKLPTTVQGTIAQENDVQVFRFDARSGQSLTAEVSAARLGSALDSLLTLYDDKDHIIASDDDSDTADSLLTVPIPRDGVYFLSLTDANGKGGAMFPFLLHVALK